MTTEQLMQMTVPAGDAAAQVLRWFAAGAMYAVATLISDVLMTKMAKGDEPPLIVTILWPLSWPLIAALVAWALVVKLWRWIAAPGPWTCVYCKWENPAGNRACGCCEPGHPGVKTNQRFTGRRLWDKKLSKPVTGVGFNDLFWTVKDARGESFLRRGWELELIDDYLAKNPIAFKVGDRAWHKGEKMFCEIKQNFLNGAELPDNFTVDFLPCRASEGRFMVVKASDLEDATLLCPPENARPNWLAERALTSRDLFKLIIEDGWNMIDGKVSESRIDVMPGNAERRRVAIEFTVQRSHRDAAKAGSVAFVPPGLVISAAGKPRGERFWYREAWSHFVRRPREESRDRPPVMGIAELATCYDASKDKIVSAKVHADGQIDVDLMHDGQRKTWRLGEGVDAVAGTDGVVRLVARVDVELAAADLCRDDSEPDLRSADAKPGAPAEPRSVPPYGSATNPMAAPGTRQDVENLREAVRKLKARVKVLEGRTED